MHPLRQGIRTRGGLAAQVLVVAAALTLAGASSAWAAGGPRLGKPHAYSKGVVEGGPGPVALADLNRDGRTDIVYSLSLGNAKTTGPNVQVLYGKRGGGFKAAKTLGTGPDTTAIDVGDVNGDRRPDVAVALRTQSGVTASVVESKPGGGYKTKAIHSDGYPDAIEIVDVNRDGRPDLVVAGQYDSIIDVFLGDGHGGFAAPKPLTTEATPFGMQVHDFTGDGKPDLAVVEPDQTYGSVLQLFAGDGHGAFAIDTTYIIGHPASQGITTGQFNDDHRLDVAVAGCNAGYNYILRGKKHGLGGAQEYPAAAYSCAEEPAAGDLTGDGRTDLATATNLFQSQSIFVSSGKADGGLGSSHSVSTHDDGDKSYLAIGHLNADGRNDLVVPSRNGKVIVFYGTRH